MTSNTKISDVKVLKRLYMELKPNLWFFVGSSTLYLPITALALAQPLIIGAAVDSGFQTGDLSNITFWAALFFFVVMGHGAIEFVQLFWVQMMGQRLVVRLRQRLFAKIQRLPMSYFDKTPLGRILTRVTNDVETLSEMFSSGAVQVFGDVLFLMGTIGMLFVVDIRLSLSTLMMLPVLAIGIGIFRLWMKHAYRWVRSQLSQMNGFLHEHLMGMQTVQQFDRVPMVISSFDRRNLEFMKANRRSILLDASIYSFVDAMSFATTAAVLWVGGYLKSQGVLQIGILVAFIEALNRFFMPIRELSNRFAVFQSALVSGERVFSMLDKSLGVRLSISPKPVHFEHAIKFENVEFGYQPGKLVLADVSFDVEKGQRIALVGHTGAGKSTITKLLTRFYDVTEGAITIDGIDIREFDVSALRELFNVVPQEVFLFSGNLRQNLAYGHASISDNEIWQALSICQARVLVEERGGLDALVDARGQNFSLGERQLFALVRAIVTNPSILILDEATASIDALTEKRLQTATKEVMKNRTCFVVAHRLSTIRNSDRIMVFHRGSLIEEGNHGQLMASQGMYAKLVELQKTEADLVPGKIPEVLELGATD